MPLSAIARRVGPPLFDLCVCALLVALAFILHGHRLALHMSVEDAQWIRGQYAAVDLRLTQTLLLSEVLRPLAQHRLELFVLARIGLHALNTVLLYLLFRALFSSLDTPLRGSAVATRAGGFLCAFLFVFCDEEATFYLSGVSYVLLVMFISLSLMAMLSFLQRGRAWRWGGVWLGYLGAVYSHVYALGVPVLLALLEWVWRRTGGPYPRRPRALARYGSLLPIPLSYVLFSWQTYRDVARDLTVGKGEGAWSWMRRGHGCWRWGITSSCRCGSTWSTTPRRVSEPPAIR